MLLPYLRNFGTRQDLLRDCIECRLRLLDLRVVSWVDVPFERRDPDSETLRLRRKAVEVFDSPDFVAAFGHQIFADSLQLFYNSVSNARCNSLFPIGVRIGGVPTCIHFERGRDVTQVGGVTLLEPRSLLCRSQPSYGLKVLYPLCECSTNRRQRAQRKKISATGVMK